MPALFCLAMRPALQEIQARLQPGDLVVAYLDDVYILTTPDRAREAHDVAKEVLKRVCGISVNQGKLQAWCHAARAAPPDLAELNLPPRPDGSLPPPVWKADLPPDRLASRCWAHL